MKELGVKVLTKIQNLISTIEKKPPANGRKGTQKFGNKQSDPNSQKLQNQEYLKKLSYSYTIKTEKTNEKLKQEVYKEEAICEHFRVSNKQTIAILGKNKYRPIYQRLDEIMGKRKNKAQEYERTKIAKEHQEISMNRSYNDLSNHDKSKYLQLSQYRQVVDQRNHHRIKKLHLLQLKSVKDKELYNGIPYISRSSRSLSKVYEQKKRLSDNVFQRLSQDFIDRDRRKKELLQHIQKEEGGYSPNLCQKSRAMAEEAKIKKPQLHFFDKSTDSEYHLKCKTKNILQGFNIHHKKSVSYINPQRQSTPIKTKQKSTLKQINEREGKQNLYKSSLAQKQKIMNLKTLPSLANKKYNLPIKEKQAQKDKPKLTIVQSQKTGKKFTKDNRNTIKQASLTKSKLVVSVKS